MTQRARPQVVWRRIIACCAVVVALWASGCSPFPKRSVADYRTVEANPNRDTPRAEALHAKALKALHHCDACYQCECVAKALCNPCKAEKHLQDALIADVRHGPSHNTLGTIYLSQHKLYLAAWEFEYAQSLMPHRPEPLNNLGLVYEESGRLGQAIECYEEAYGMDPTSAESIGNLARASLKEGAEVEEVRHLLDELLLYDSRPEWLAWARDLLGTESRGGTRSFANSSLEEDESTDDGPALSPPSPEAAELLPAPGEKARETMGADGEKTLQLSLPELVAPRE